MIDFNDIHGATKEERVRAWAVEKAAENGSFPTEIVDNAIKIENYIKNGSDD